MSGLMSIGTRAMFANYAALQTTGHNIANASTEGYSRQSTELATSGGQYTGAGFFGQGVDVASVTRAADAFLTRESQLATAQASQDATRHEQLQRLEKVFATGEQGLGYASGQLLNAFIDVANRPQDAAARQVVLARAEEVAARFRSANAQIDQLQAGVTQDLTTSVATVNGLAKRVAEINQRIAAAQGGGQPPNDLLDQRDALVKEISGYLQVTTIAADDGSLGLFVGGGQRLVLGTQALELKVVPDDYDPQRVRVAIAETGGNRLLDGSALAGGSIAGLLAFQDEDLTAARASIGQMASALSGRLNEQQALGLDLRTPPGSGAALFAVAAPRVLPAAGNTGANTVSLAIADVSQLQASDYELRGDPSVPGQYTLTRLSDGLVRTVVAGDTVDGFTIGIGIPAPAAADRFLLQPTSQAATAMRRVLDDPRGIAAASPVAATTGSANTGTASVASLRVVDPSIDPSLTASISFTDASGSYDWELRDAANTLVASGSATWSAGTAIALNGFELELAGVPAAGDTVQVAATQFPAANNGNALALLALRDEAMVGEQDLGGGTIVPGQSITDAYASAMAAVGVKVQSAASQSQISSAVATNADALKAQKTGVNLDEEAARLIQYQQGYQAAAKMLQVAQSVFDTLLQMGR